MCDVCGCGDPARTKLVQVDVGASLLSKNDRDALVLRQRFRELGITALNLMGSPGSGKTALLEATARALGGQRLSAVSGDLATTHDADRLTRAGLTSAPITTGTACHLDAAMVGRALQDHPLLGESMGHSDYFFIENVGNLVCPAIYDLGQQANVVALAVTEGVDKPLKYPVMFKNADLVVLTKTDLLPYLPDISVAAILDNLARVMPKPRMIQLAATRDQGLQEWLAWLQEQRDQVLAVGPAKPTAELLRRASRGLRPVAKGIG